MADGHRESHQEKATRQRRLGDAAKLMPALAAVLMAVPVLWTPGTSTTVALIYVFTLWCVLIVMIALISRALSRSVSRSEGRGPERRAER